jgi:hypothetical protein
MHDPLQISIGLALIFGGLTAFYAALKRPLPKILWPWWRESDPMMQDEETFARQFAVVCALLVEMLGMAFIWAGTNLPPSPAS